MMLLCRFHCVMVLLQWGSTFVSGGVLHPVPPLRGGWINGDAENAGLEYAGPEYAAPNCRGGICRTGKYGTNLEREK